VTSVLDRVTSFPQQLRAATADLHAAVEVVADLPGSVETVGDYGDLLSAFYAAHLRIEAAVEVRGSEQDWGDLGIDVAGGRQLDLLTEDLVALGLTPEPRRSTEPVLNNPAEALGCVYVVEGSAIGRRILAPLLKKRLGDVPSAFFDGVGRHPQAWRDVQGALALCADDPVRQDSVLAGAKTAFEIFLDCFRQRAEHRELGRR
jgi:heme oxygenase